MPGYLPQDFQPEILKRLPVKSLLRFRCVCKWWRQLIDSHSFVQQHISSVQNPRFLVFYSEPEFKVLDPHTLPSLDTLNWPIELGRQVHPVGTLHGVVCLYETYGDFYLWNPTLRKLSSIGYPEIEYYQWFEYHDENQLADYSSFWIDPSTKHFKVIVFKLYMFELESEFGDFTDGVVYSSIRREWKVFPLGEVRNCKPLQECPAVMIGGVAHWRAQVTCKEASMDVVVLAFDFVRERFDIIEAPSVEYEGWYHPVLSKWQDTLSLMYMDPEKRCDVYTRQGGSWANMFRFNVIASDITRVLWLFGEMEQRSCRFLATASRELVLSLCETGGAGRIPSEESDTWDFDLFLYVAYDFVESLLFPIKAEAQEQDQSGSVIHRFPRSKRKRSKRRFCLHSFEV